MAARLSPGVLLLWAGSGILLGSAFVGWYFFHYEGTTGQVGAPGGAEFAGTTTFLPGSEFRAESYCSGDPRICDTSGNPNVSGLHSYSNPGDRYDGYANTGNLYQWLQGIVLVGAVLGFGAGTLRLLSQGDAPGWRSFAFFLAIVATLLALLAPALVFVENPVRTHADYTAPGAGLPRNFTGPGGSFWGSCSQPSCGSGGGITDSWGPASGWYWGWGSFAILLSGVVVTRVESRRPPQAAGAAK